MVVTVSTCVVNRGTFFCTSVLKIRQHRDDGEVFGFEYGFTLSLKIVLTPLETLHFAGERLQKQN